MGHVATLGLRVARGMGAGHTRVTSLRLCDTPQSVDDGGGQISGQKGIQYGLFAGFRPGNRPPPAGAWRRPAPMRARAGRSAHANGRRRRLLDELREAAIT